MIRHTMFFVMITLVGLSYCHGQTNNESETSTTDVEQIQELIVKLESVESFDVTQISIALANFKGIATPYLIDGLKSPHASVRKGCCLALTCTVGGFQDYSGRHFVATAAEPLLAAALAENDQNVLWYMAQAIDKLRPPADKAIPVLIELSKRGDGQHKSKVIQVFGNYGAKAAPARPRLHQIYTEAKEDGVLFNLRTQTHRSLQKIGIHPDDVQLISTTQLSDSREIATALMILLDYPEGAVEFLEKHPNALETEEICFVTKLSEIFEQNAASTSRLRRYLEAREDLPELQQLRIGTPEQLVALKKKFGRLEQDPYRQSFVSACIRAIEGPLAPPTLTISKTEPGDFRPASALPDGDKRRRAKVQTQESCFGYTEILVTGTLLVADGSDSAPAKNPKFYFVREKVPDGNTKKFERPLVKYDDSTGRFAFVTDVDAVYSFGSGQEQPGPFKTGSDKLLIEAENGESLTVEFYDEMPDVKIMLAPK